MTASRTGPRIPTAEEEVLKTFSVGSSPTGGTCSAERDGGPPHPHRDHRGHHAQHRGAEPRDRVGAGPVAREAGGHGRERRADLVGREDPAEHDGPRRAERGRGTARRSAARWPPSRGRRSPRTPPCSGAPRRRAAPAAAPARRRGRSSSSRAAAAGRTGRSASPTRSCRRCRRRRRRRAARRRSSAPCRGRARPGTKCVPIRPLVVAPQIAKPATSAQNVRAVRGLAQGVDRQPSGARPGRGGHLVGLVDRRVRARLGGLGAVRLHAAGRTGCRAAPAAREVRRPGRPPRSPATRARHPACSATTATTGRKTSWPVALPAVRMPVTRPRRLTNQRCATVAAKTSAIDPVPSPIRTPQVSTSCQLACTNTREPGRRAATSTGRTAVTRRIPNRSISAAANGAVSPNSTRLTPDRERQGAAAPAELVLQRHHQHARAPPGSRPRRAGRRRRRRRPARPGGCGAGGATVVIGSPGATVAMPTLQPRLSSSKPDPAMRRREEDSRAAALRLVARRPARSPGRSTSSATRGCCWCCARRSPGAPGSRSSGPLSACADNVLSRRLSRDGARPACWCARRTTTGHRTREEYLLTEAGGDLLPVLHALAQWGERHRPARTGRLAVVHEGCGEPTTAPTRAPPAGRG